MLRWTEEQLADYRARHKPPDVSNVPFAPPPSEPARFALGRLPVGAMNKTEAAYDAHLRELQAAGDVLWFKFEALKFRLADNTFYSPDFIVLPRSGFIEAHEVKGFWQDDARVKIKVAAALYPVKFVAVKARAKKAGGGWEREEF